MCALPYTPLYARLVHTISAAPADNIMSFKTSIFRHATVTKNVGRRIAGKVVPKPKWHFIDGKNQVVGRLASDISRVLMGKHKPTYLPNIDSGDYVVVTNARHIALTGKKKEQKVYRWHTGYVGNLKEINVNRLLEKKPEEVLRKAVLGMLPKNRLKRVRASKLHIFPDEDHSFSAQAGRGFVGKFPRTKSQE